MQSTTAERTNAHRGISKRLSTCDQSRDPGMAPSRQKGEGQRLEVIKPQPQKKKKIQKRRKKNKNPPPADPVAVLKIRPIGCPLPTSSKSETSGRTKRMGIR